MMPNKLIDPIAADRISFEFGDPRSSGVLE
jgi:hypothetical protein